MAPDHAHPSPRYCSRASLQSLTECIRIITISPAAETHRIRVVKSKWARHLPCLKNTASFVDSDVPNMGCNIRLRKRFLSGVGLETRCPATDIRAQRQPQCPSNTWRVCPTFFRWSLFVRVNVPPFYQLTFKSGSTSKPFLSTFSPTPAWALMPPTTSKPSSTVRQRGSLSWPPPADFLSL